MVKRIQIFSLFLFIMLSVGAGLIQQLVAQSLKPGINFQALARDKNAIVAGNKPIYVQTEIISADSSMGSLFTEEHFTKSDAAGIFSVSIGKGQRVGGSYFSLYEIPWRNLHLFLRIKIAIPPSLIPANWNYQQEWYEVGTAPFEIVPYALYAQSSASSLNLKSKSRSDLVQHIDSFVIQLELPLEIDDGISISLEAFRLPMSVPNFFLFRDIQKNRVIVYFTAPFSGYVSWMILE
jgi:hypothetical protein